jgi:hypothetical protein
VILSGSTYETEVGYVDGQDTTTTLHGTYVSRSSADHPDFTRFQANDESYYVVPVTANASISNIATGSRLRIYNETTATETYNGVPGTSYSDSYTEGTTYTAGDVVKIYLTQINTVTAKLSYLATTVAASTGWTVIADQVSDDVYDQYGIDGSTLTGTFTADYTDDEVDIIVATDFTAAQFYAWWVYNLTTSQGISDFYGGITANDAANIKINDSTVSIFLDNTTTTNIKQTDNIRIYRNDEAYPVINPTTGGGGIDVVWRDKIYIANVGGSTLTPAESALLTSINSNLGTVLTKATDMHNRDGLDATDPVVITPTAITTSRLSQTISGDGETSSTVTRDP